MKNLFLTVALIALFSAVTFSQAPLSFTEYGGYGNTQSYEAGSVRAMMSWYNVNRMTAAGFTLRSMTFEQIGTYAGPEVQLEIGDSSKTPISNHTGQLVSTEQVKKNQEYTVVFGTSKKGYLITNSNYGFTLAANVPTGFDGQTLGFRLISYEVQQSNGFRISYGVFPSGILPFNIAASGSNGFAQLPLDLSVSVVRGGPPVNAFVLESIFAGSFAFMGYPTWFGSGVNTDVSSGGISPGSSFQVKYQAVSGVPAGTYVGSQVIQNGNGIARSSRVAVTVL